jgi:signal transduction histidine kinase
MANSGVAVFDRNFRVRPYGFPGDDWLQLSADNARNYRDPRSSVARKHFPMSPEVRSSTSENYMLRLPQPAQLVGLVQVEGRRTSAKGEGLVPSADREGFVENEAFLELVDIIRAGVEVIAFADRTLQQEEERRQREALLASVRSETRSAIAEIQQNPNIAPGDKQRIVTAIAQTQKLAEQHEQSARQREQQLEVMSLLGVVAGFMTHEFGVALQELETTHRDLIALSETDRRFAKVAAAFAEHIRQLREFVTYASGYIQGAKVQPTKPYPARPRLLQVKRIFGKYADERGIEVRIDVESDVHAPLVPASLYNGIALNLYTNALKAVTAKLGDAPGVVTFRAWNDNRWHYLDVADTGVGVPAALHERIFDPLFTTTQSENDPLGSGMGLGLALVRRGAEAFGGRVDLVDPPQGFATCVRVKLPVGTL